MPCSRLREHAYASVNMAPVLEFVHQDAEQVVEIGNAFQGFLDKPISLPQLTDSLRSHVSQGTTEGSLFVPPQISKYSTHFFLGFSWVANPWISGALPQRTSISWEKGILRDQRSPQTSENTNAIRDGRFFNCYNSNTILQRRMVKTNPVDFEFGAKV